MKTVDKIMTKDVVTVFETATFSEIKHVFDTYYFHHLPVLDFSNQLKGIISKKDLAKATYLLSLNTRDKTHSTQEFDHISANSR